MTFDLFNSEIVCFCMYLYGPHTFVWKKCWLLITLCFQMTSPLKPLVQCWWNFMWSLFGAGKRKIAKMGMVHWSKWLPFKKSSPEPNKPWALIFAQIIGDRRSTKFAIMMVLCWPLTFLRQGQIASPCICMGHIYIYIRSTCIKVTCRSTVAKVVLIGNLRWLSCICLGSGCWQPVVNSDFAIDNQ